MKLFIALTTLWIGLSAHAKPGFKSGFIEIRPGDRLYFEHKRATNGKPTLFLVNGLTYSTTQWQSYVNELLRQDPDLGIFTYDMEGQGRTLLEKAPINFDIPIEKQVNDLHDLRKKLNIQGPATLAGLSYGAAVTLYYASLYPKDFDRFIAIAPFLERLENQDRMIKNYIAVHKHLYPWDPRTEDELYDLYLRVIVSTYPSAEPVILENPFKFEGIYRMVKGAKNWRAIEKAHLLPLRKVHVVGAERDEYVKLDQLTQVAEAYKSRALASFMIVEGTRHKIPEYEPEFLAAWTLKILSGDEWLERGLTFHGDPESGEVRQGSTVTPIKPKGGWCETLLRSLSRIH